MSTQQNPASWLVWDDEGESIVCATGITLLEALREMMRYDYLAGCDEDEMERLDKEGADRLIEYVEEKSGLINYRTIPPGVHPHLPSCRIGGEDMPAYCLKVLTDEPFAYGCFEGPVDMTSATAVALLLMGHDPEDEGFTFFNTGDADLAERRLMPASEAIRLFPERITGLDVYIKAWLRLLSPSRAETLEQEWARYSRGSLRYLSNLYLSLAGDTPALLDSRQLFSDYPPSSNKHYDRYGHISLPEDVVVKAIPGARPYERRTVNIGDDLHHVSCNMQQSELRPVYSAVRDWFLERMMPAEREQVVE